MQTLWEKHAHYTWINIVADIQPLYPWVPEVYRLPIQMAGWRLAKWVDSTKQMKWAKCCSRVTSGSSHHFRANTWHWNWASDVIPGQTGFTYVTRDYELSDILISDKQHKIKMMDNVDAVEVLFKIAYT